MWQDSFICLTWLFRIYLTCLICIFSMTYSCVTYSCICVAWLIHRFGITHSYVDHVLCVCVTWLIHIYDNDMTHSCMSHTWCIHTCDLAHWYVWHDTLIRVTWLTHMCHICLICDRTHSYVWHGTLICLTWLWSQRPPPFLFPMFPDQEPCVRGFTTRCDRRISSWNLYTRLFIREHSKYKPPPGGGVSFDQLIHMFSYHPLRIHTCDNSCILANMKESWHIWIFAHSYSPHAETNTGWRRPTGCLNFTDHFSQKSPVIISPFAQRDLQLKAS